MPCFTHLFEFIRQRKINKSSKSRESDLQSSSLTVSRTVGPPNYAASASTNWSHGRTNTHVLTEKPPTYSVTNEPMAEFLRPEVLRTIEDTIVELDPELRKLSLEIWSHPELGYEEIFAHRTLTRFMASRGFKVQGHYGLATAWRADFVYSASSTSSTRCIGINAEMDALPGIGHACGHNLIAMAGVGTALALMKAMQKHDISGRIILLGTPAEEGGGGKIQLLDHGAYDEMDVCIMCHPTPGSPRFSPCGPSLASQPIEVEFFGHSAHAAFAPWEGQNALDAAFLAYSAVSALRQQIHPTHRVHGIVTGKDWAPNVIPDYAKMRWIVRAPTWAQLEVLRERVVACFDAAAHATGCKIELKQGVAYYDLRQNEVLANEFARVMETQYDWTTEIGGVGASASTDFGNVTYALPSVHPSFTIPTPTLGGNHTPQFTEAARTPEAHAAALDVIKGLAATGARVLLDEAFADEVKKFFDDGADERLRALGRLAGSGN